MKNLFYEDPYKKEVDTQVIAIFSEDGKDCLQLEENIFYPQGGGQKGDRGKIECDGQIIKIVDSIKDQYSDDGVVLIAESSIPKEWKGRTVNAILDWDFRFQQMKLHSLVHMHHFFMEKIVEKKIPYPKTSDLQEDFAFNRYETADVTEELAQKASKLLQEAIHEGASVKTYADPQKKGFRFWECIGIKVPCGGVHVSDIAEIGNFETSFSKKKGKPTVNLKLK